MAILREVVARPSDAAGLEEVARLAGDVLKQDGVIAYPTETVYGLGCDLESEAGYRLILGLKGLRRRKPMILLIPGVEWLHELMAKGTWSRVADLLTGAFWPGPLTLVVPASDRVPAHLLGVGRTVSMRLSPDPFVQVLLEHYPRPITSTSANPTDHDPATGLPDLRRYFASSPYRIGLAIDGGERSGPPSTIVRVTSRRPAVVREGAIAASRIHDAGRA